MTQNLWVWYWFLNSWKKVTKKFIREKLRTYSRSGGKKEFLNFYYDEQIFSAFCTNFVPILFTVLEPGYISTGCKHFFNQKCHFHNCVLKFYFGLIHRSCFFGTKPSLLKVNSFGHSFTQGVTRDVVYCTLADQ